MKFLLEEVKNVFPRHIELERGMDKHQIRHLLKKSKLEMRQDKEHKEFIRKATKDRNARIHQELAKYRKRKELEFVGHATYTRSWWRHPVGYFDEAPSVLTRFYSFDDALERSIDNPHALTEGMLIHLGMAEIDDEFRDYNSSLRRVRRRTAAVRSELLESVRRRNCIRACHVVKEELIANVWHPRRTENWLALGNESYLFDE